MIQSLLECWDCVVHEILSGSTLFFGIYNSQFYQIFCRNDAIGFWQQAKIQTSKNIGNPKCCFLHQRVCESSKKLNFRKSFSPLQNLFNFRILKLCFLEFSQTRHCFNSSTPENSCYSRAISLFSPARIIINQKAR